MSNIEEKRKTENQMALEFCIFYGEIAMKEILKMV